MKIGITKRMHEWTPVSVSEIVTHVDELGRSRNQRYLRQSADDTSRLGIIYIHIALYGYRVIPSLCGVFEKSHVVEMRIRVGMLLVEVGMEVPETPGWSFHEEPNTDR